MLVPFLVLFAARLLPHGSAPSRSQTQDTLAHLARNRDLAAVTFGHYILYLFYIWAPLYVPVYLHTILGIPWSTLGWMFSLMLLPYVLIEYPAGWIADRKLGDKKLMLLGFLIAGLSLAAIGLLTADSSPALILIILLGTRIGAALIESMTEGHFFRCVSENVVVSVSVFRGVWPLANFTAPLIASSIIFWGNYPLLFILTGGFIVIAGAITTSFIRDFNPKQEPVCLP
jgi:MFS family permease